jgi:hypothetical protein
MTLKEKIENYLLNSESTGLFATEDEVQEAAKDIEQICIREKLELLENLKTDYPQFSWFLDGEILILKSQLK